MTDTRAVLDGIERWVRHESHSVDAADVSRLIQLVADEFSAAGLSSALIPGTDGCGDHLLARTPWGGDGPGVLVLCHVDTVHPKGTLASRLPFRIEGDRAYGPGIYDMKGGAYLPLAALRAITAARRTTPLPIRLLYTSDEEIGSPTSRALIQAEAARAKYVLVTEPARDGGRIVTARKGVGRYVITAHGRPAHAGSRPQDGRSAIVEMAHQVVALIKLADAARGLTITVGQIRGGTADNVVPETCSANIDVRVMTKSDGVAVDRHLKSLRPVTPDVRLEVTGEINRPPYEKNAGVAALFEHARKIARDIPLDLVDMHTGGGSDGNFTAHAVPTLDGLGVDGHGAHTHDEHMLISSIAPRLALMRRLFETLQ
jgi:glutamate carboxypeptidase